VSDDRNEVDIGDILDAIIAEGFLQGVRDAVGFGREDGG
jgi:hypothetical protein